MAEKELRSIQFPGLEDVYVVPEGGGGATGPAGKDGLTPTIGANGNWYLGDEDTGKPSRGEKGDPGEKGADGAAGKDGSDGYSPEATVTQINGGAKIIIKDKNGTTSANVMNGAQGPKGDAGPQGDVGPKGDSYTLTTADKSEIAEAVVAGGVQAELGDEPVSLGITGAQVGQIAKITAVDTDGKPTAWEPVDMAGGGEREWEVIADIITTSEDVLHYRYDVPDKKELIVLVSLTPLADSTSPVNGTIAINGTGNPWNGNNYTYISGNILSVKSSERSGSVVLSGEIIDRKWVPKSLFSSLNRGASWNALRPDGTMPLTSDDTTNACSFTSVDAIRSVAVGSYTKWFGVGSHIYILAR